MTQLDDTIGSVSAQNFNSFASAYDTLASRRDLAERLIPVNGVITPRNENPTRSILAAQWADSNPDLLQTANFLYRQKGFVDKYIGETLLSFRVGEPGDLKAPEAGFVSSMFIELGTIAHKEVYYGFRRGKGPQVDDRRSNYLEFQVSVPVTKGQSLAISRSGSVEQDSHFREESEVVTYAGTVLLNDNVIAYHQTRRIVRSRLVFGNLEAFLLLREIVKRAGDAPADKLEAMLDRGDLKPNQPLPDLAGLFAV